jgi:zinc transport system substrate-binding protein
VAPACPNEPVRRTLSPTRLAARAAAAFLAASVAFTLAAPPLRVTVSLAPYASIVEEIGGDNVSVTTLLPPGASPHVFDPTPSQAAGLASSDLIVMNGGLDAWLDRLVAAAAPSASVLVITQSIAFTPEADEHDHEHEHEHDDDHAEDDAAADADAADPATANPHIWLDPMLMREAAAAIAAELARLDPDNAAAYGSGLTRVQEELDALDVEIAALLEPVKGAPFVPFHDAWPYFAQRYGLDLVLSLEPFPGREPSPKYVAEAVAAVKATGAKAVFAERQLNPRSAEVVAESAGVAVAVLDPIGGAPGPTDYAELLRYNARIILENLR